VHVRKEGSGEFPYFVDTGTAVIACGSAGTTWMVKMTLIGEEVFWIRYPKESPH
jgi:hypothetical protein